MRMGDIRYLCNDVVAISDCCMRIHTVQRIFIPRDVYFIIIFQQQSSLLFGCPKVSSKIDLLYPLLLPVVALYYTSGYSSERKA